MTVLCVIAADTICEGFDHAEAPPTDLHAAAQQLKLATIQEYQKRLAYKPSRKQSKKAAAAAQQQAESSSSSSRTVKAHGAGQAKAGGSSSSNSDASWQEKLRKLQGMLDFEE